MTKSLAAFIFAIGLMSVAISQLLFKAGMLQVVEQAGLQPRLAMMRHALGTPMLWIGAVALVTGTICWYTAMLRLPLSLMMPLSSLIAPVVSVAAWYLFGEHLNIYKLTAIIIIMIGAIWLGFLSG